MLVEQQNTPATPPVGDAGQIEANPPVKASVGEVLRATRLRLGIDLGAVAATLHIRVSFLEAIESGNYDALPGGTYAVGFIRSYGEQLGLDGVELVRRFKHETGADVAVTPEPPNFPAPVKGGGLPFGAIATGLAVAGGLAFAGWYLVSGSESTTTLLPRIPAALNEKITPPRPKAAPEAPVTPPEAPAAVPETPAPVAVAPVPEPPAAMTPAPLPAKPAPTPAPAQAEVPKPVPPKPEPPKPEPEPQAAAPAAQPAPAPAKPAVVPPAPPRPVVDENSDTPPASPDTLSRQARVYGEENAGARIELVATADAWVQVTENGSLVLTRLMHSGDRFLVPNRSGLTLMTGNAGGLSILVDGQKAPPLGGQGQVVRDVALSADRLRGSR